MKTAGYTFCLLVGLVMMAGCGSQDSGSKKLQLAFVINTPDNFWVLARAGIRKAEKDFDVEVDFQVPGQSSPAQQAQIIRTLIAKGIDGMAISVLNAEGQIGIINEAAEYMPVVTQDSDCPESNRKVYIGTDNVAAGRLAGEQVVKALPEGGKIAIFVGKLDQANAHERRQGVIEATKDHGIEVVDTFTDEGQRPVAQSNVRAALDKYPDLKCLVGLWAYNPPAIVQVLEERELTGKIKVVGFDEDLATLDAISEGIVEATVVQQPYQFGYKSIEVLTKLARGEDPKLPDNKLMYVPVKVIDQSTAKEFRKEVERMLKEGQ